MGDGSRGEKCIEPRRCLRLGTRHQVAVEVFTCLDEAQILVADWRADYTNHHHSALGMMSPARFAASWQRIGNTNVPVNPRLSLVDR